jgi:outer membrane protein, multidrug efflux system
MTSGRHHPRLSRFARETPLPKGEGGVRPPSGWEGEGFRGRRLTPSSSHASSGEGPSFSPWEKGSRSALVKFETADTGRGGGGIARALEPLALAGLLLAGCIDMAPRYHRPPEPTPATFPTGPAYPAPSAAVQGVVGWRDFFSDPKLVSVIEAALANNRDLRAAVENIAIARAQYQVQRAGQFPQIAATAGATIGQEPASVATGVSTPGQGEINIRQYNVGVGVAAYQLDLFGKLRNLTRAAQEQYFATRQARDAAQITLVGQVAVDYLALASDRSLLKIAQDTVVSGGETVDLTRARFTGGIASQLDVAQAQTILEAARFDVARLTTQVAQDRNALDLVVGAPVGDDLLPAAIGAPVVVLSRLPEGLTSAVLLRRPDVLAAEDQLEGTNANIGAARAAFFPSITLTGSGGLISTSLSTLFQGAAATWTFAPALTQPIFDAGLNRANLALAKAQRDLAIDTYEKAVQTAFREVADALAQRGTIDAELAAQRALVAAADTSLRLANARYEKGADTFLNVLIAQRAYFVGQETLVTTQQTEAANLVTLYTALGGGLDAAR